MIKIFKISGFAFILCFLCAPSCVDEQERVIRDEALLKEEQMEIRREFETDYLDEASLYANEETAKQKLYDLADYFHMLSDTSLDMSFRRKAGEMIQRMFLSDKIKLSLFPQEGDKDNEVGMLIRRGLENTLPPHSFSFDSVRIQEPLHRIGNATYSGNLTFIQYCNDLSNPGQAIKSYHRYSDIHIVKEDKIFGSDTLSIWNVRLGEIR